jgi:hypothetical protein
MRSKLAVFICAAIVAALTVAPTSVAQMTQCSGASGGANYKVLIDEVQYATSTGNQQVLSLELIQSSVEGALEKLRRGILSRNVPQGTILYLNCKGRHPQGASDFDDSLMRNMAANHAILEFWGTLFPLGGGQHKFDIHYVMFPVASLTPPAPSGIAATEKTMATKPTSEEVRRYLINTRADLPAYFTAAAGVQAYADRNWDQAVRFLCEARTRLKRNPAQQDLMNFADQLASKAAAELRKNDNTVASLLTDAQAKDYCSFATTR